MIKGFKFEPVRWMTVIVGVLTAVETVNEAAHLLPVSWSPYILGAIAILTGIFGALARAKVTPVAAPRGEDGERLVPASMR